MRWIPDEELEGHKIEKEYADIMGDLIDTRKEIYDLWRQDNERVTEARKKIRLSDDSQQTNLAEELNRLIKKRDQNLYLLKILIKKVKTAVIFANDVIDANSDDDAEFEASFEALKKQKWIGWWIG